MGELGECSGSKRSSEKQGNAMKLPKVEVLDANLPSYTQSSSHVGENVASTSGSCVRSNFIGMGFSPPLVDKAIKENGENDVELILETLFAYSAAQKSSSESSDSLDEFFNDTEAVSNTHDLTADNVARKAPQKSSSESSDSLDDLFNDDDDASKPLQFASGCHPKAEPEVFDAVKNSARASLLMMNFSADQVDFAINKLGEEAPVNELMDFIIASQIAEKFQGDNATHGDEEVYEESKTEILFGTMDKTLRLLEMGFSEQQVSYAIERFGSELPVAEIADLIFTDQIAGATVKIEEDVLPASSVNYTQNGHIMGNRLKRHSFEMPMVKTEDLSLDAHSQGRNFDYEEIRKGKRIKEEHTDDSTSFVGPAYLSSRNGNSQSTSSSRYGSSKDQIQAAGELPKIPKPEPCKILFEMVAGPPYFFYGSVANLSHESWTKVSQFLYAVEPEFVNTQFFSALIRKEGYAHNLPTEKRFHIHPKSPLSIEEAIPHSKKWWPSWDTRKQLSCINSETSGISQLCDRLGRILVNSQGLLSVEQQTDILHHCRTLNLVWVSHHKLGPMEPDYLEQILGYPLHYTQDAEWNLADRLQSLKHSFQTDTLGYHLSVLKSMFPGGLRLLSLYSGIGGVEVTLHRLGVPMKGVVSVESSPVKRNILKKWWQNTEQTGELVQIEDIQKVSSKKLEHLINRFGGFDLIVCQNPTGNTSKISKLDAEDGDCIAGFDFTSFYEFVRILQRVRNTMGRNG